MVVLEEEGHPSAEVHVAYSLDGALVEEHALVEVEVVAALGQVVVAEVVLEEAVSLVEAHLEAVSLAVVHQAAVSLAVARELELQVAVVVLLVAVHQVVVIMVEVFAVVVIVEEHLHVGSVQSVALSI